MNAAFRSRVMMLAAALTLPATAVAQDTARTTPWLTALSVGFPAIDGEFAPIAFTVGANFTKIRAGALSPDFSIGTMPVALSFGALVWGARAGLALPLEVTPNILILPSAGLSVIGLMGDGALGTNAGIAMASRSGARIGLTWHRFSGSDDGAVLLEIGVGRIR